MFQDSSEKNKKSSKVLSDLDESQNVLQENEAQNNKSTEIRGSLSFANYSPVTTSKDLSISKNVTFADLSFYLADLEQRNKELSFQKFVLFSIEDNDFSLDKVKSWGSNNLSPLVLQSGSVCYQFPTFDENPKEKELFPFCYPHGLEVRIMPRYLSEQAKELGWMGRKADKYQIHEVSFTLWM